MPNYTCKCGSLSSMRSQHLPWKPRFVLLSASRLDTSCIVGWFLLAVLVVLTRLRSEWCELVIFHLDSSHWQPQMESSWPNIRIAWSIPETSCIWLALKVPNLPPDPAWTLGPAEGRRWHGEPKLADGLPRAAGGARVSSARGIAKQWQQQQQEEHKNRYDLCATMVNISFHCNHISKCWENEVNLTKRPPNNVFMRGSSENERCNY